MDRWKWITSIICINIFTPLIIIILDSHDMRLFGLQNKQELMSNSQQIRIHLWSYFEKNKQRGQFKR